MLIFVCCDGWTIHVKRNHGTDIIGPSLTIQPRTIQLSSLVGDDVSVQGPQSTSSSPSQISWENLVDMDVVIYSLLPSAYDGNDNKNRNINADTNNNSPQLTILRFAAIQEDGVLSPLSAWTTDPAFGTSVELLVDEADRFVLSRCMDKVRLHHLLSEEELSYGSRQCHRGVGNPHGEESELLYYVEQDVINRFQVVVDIKPHLEILW
jgi:hypothetical protein